MPCCTRRGIGSLDYHIHIQIPRISKLNENEIDGLVSRIWERGDSKNFLELYILTGFANFE
jgi:hypothetical protein